jgi:Aspartate decarboxylase
MTSAGMVTAAQHGDLVRRAAKGAKVKTFVGAKIHGIRVTDKSVRYHGSVSIAQDLMDAVHIEPYERKRQN